MSTEDSAVFTLLLEVKIAVLKGFIE